MVAHIVRDDGVASSNLVTSTIRDGFSAVSFLLPFYAKMLKNGLSTEVLSTATIKLGKLEAKKLTRHKQSHKQSFKLSTILDRKKHKKSLKILPTVRMLLALGNFFQKQLTPHTVSYII